MTCQLSNFAWLRTLKLLICTFHCTTPVHVQIQAANASWPYPKFISISDQVCMCTNMYKHVHVNDMQKCVQVFQHAVWAQPY